MKLADLDVVIEKMDKLMSIGGFDTDGDVLVFWIVGGEDEEAYYGEVHVPFNMKKLRARYMGEIETAIRIIDNIESGEYSCLLTTNGGIDLSGVFE